MPRDSANRPSGRLRVIAGELRGRRLRAPRGTLVRPTADRVREALFDILGSRVAGASFLDAYAGTGAVGIEAISRGAAHVTFVEREPEMVALVKANIEASGVSSARARVIGRDLGTALPLMERSGAGFSLVYVDPPYAGGELDRALRLIARSPIVPSGALVIAEHESRQPVPAHAGLGVVRTAVYGRSALSFLEKDGVAARR